MGFDYVSDGIDRLLEVYRAMSVKPCGVVIIGICLSKQGSKHVQKGVGGGAV
jgi:hypothetical protein